MNINEKIDVLVDIFDECLENRVNISFIGESEHADELLIELELLGYTLLQDDDDIEELLDENQCGIMTVTLICYEDKHYVILDEAVNQDGYTVDDCYSDIIIIEDDVFDCVDLDYFSTETIFSISEESDEDICNGDCANCYQCEDNDIDLYDIIDRVADDATEFIEDGECIKCTVVNAIKNVLDIIYEDENTSF